MTSTVAYSVSENNLLDFTPFEIEPTSYDASCVQYEEATDRKLKGDTIILGGYGASIKVERKALVLTYGRMSEEDKVQKLFKGTHKVRQIILVSDGGYISIEAISWCVDQDITLYLLDWRGSLIQVLSPKHPSSAKLIWQQYNATQNDLGLSICVELVRRKVQSQLDTLALYPHLPKQAWAMDILEHGLYGLRTVQSIEKLRKAEGTIASVYFAAITGIPIKWDNRTAKIVPPHWLQITGRNSPLSKNHGARWSINPFHSCLNFAFALLEGQVLRAVIMAGLEPTCGYLHAYQAEKNTLCHDLMEPFRAVIDAKMLDFFDKTTFKRGDFYQVLSGECRLNEELRRYILANCRVAQSDIDALAVWLKRTLQDI